MTQVPMPFGKLKLGYPTVITVEGSTRLTEGELAYVKEALAKLAGTYLHLSSCRSSVSQVANLAIDRVVVNCTSSIDEYEAGIFKFSVLGPYGDIRLNHALQRTSCN